MEKIINNGVQFAKGMLSYCDNMESKYDATSLDGLKRRAVQFIAILEEDSIDLSALDKFIGEMEIERINEGTGFDRLYFHAQTLRENIEEIT